MIGLVALEKFNAIDQLASHIIIEISPHVLPQPQQFVASCPVMLKVCVPAGKTPMAEAFISSQAATLALAELVTVSIDCLCNEPFTLIAKSQRCFPAELAIIITLALAHHVASDATEIVAIAKVVPFAADPGQPALVSFTSTILGPARNCPLGVMMAID